MSNICDNTMYVYTESEENLNTIISFFDKNFYSTDYQLYNHDNSLDIYFDSKWVFPEEKMKELYELIPNKEDIYMRCLSVEYGTMYHALWYCDKDGWHES